MRIIVLSDSHGAKYAAEEVLELQKSAKDVIFLGDGLRDIEAIENFYPDHRFYKVAGNCDFSSGAKNADLIEIGDRKIFYTHGHLFHVKYGLYELKAAARQRGADIVLYGHTHEAFTDYDDGLYIMNPGSLSAQGSGRNEYGFIDITPAGIVTCTAKL